MTFIVINDPNIRMFLSADNFSSTLLVDSSKEEGGVESSKAEEGREGG